MPRIVSDVLEVMPVRWHNGVFEIAAVPFSGSRIAGHDMRTLIQGRVMTNETALEAAKRLAHDATGLRVTAIYSLDLVHQVLDSQRDALVLAPVLAVTFAGGTVASPTDWMAAEDMSAFLPIPGDRRAVERAIALLHAGGAHRDLFRIM